MDPRPLGRTGLRVSPIGFGAFKIGRNEGVKYPRSYRLPDDRAVASLVDGLLGMGVTYFDTAPAYGVSEQRLGRALAGRRDEIVLSTKAGETFEDGVSRYDFSGPAIERSVVASLERLRTDAVDIVLLHSDGSDEETLARSEAAATLERLKRRGLTRAVGFSGKTVAGADAALDWADVLMVAYNLDDRSHEAVLRSARERGVGMVVKKGLGSGHLEPDAALRFLLGMAGIGSVVVGSLSLDNMRRNVATATATATPASRPDQATSG